MRRKSCVALGAGLLALTAGPAAAQGASSGTTGTDTGASTSSGTGKQLAGRIDRIDRSTNTLTLDGRMLKMDSSTEVTKDGSRATLSDVKEGDQVRASFSGSGDTLNVQRIEVMGTEATGSGSTTTGSKTSASSPATGSGDRSSSKKDTSVPHGTSTPPSGTKSY
jgi:hypothetical protein